MRLRYWPDPVLEAPVDGHVELHSTALPDGGWLLRLTDEGPGLPPEQLGRRDVLQDLAVPPGRRLEVVGQARLVVGLEQGRVQGQLVLADEVALDAQAVQFSFERILDQGLALADWAGFAARRLGFLAAAATAHGPTARSPPSDA